MAGKKKKNLLSHFQNLKKNPKTTPFFMRRFCQVQYRHKISFSPLKTAFHMAKGNACVPGRGWSLSGLK